MKEKVVVIAGSSSKIGIELTKKYIDKGHVTYGLDIESKNVFGLKFIPCDITNVDNCQIVIDKIIQEQGRIDILINNVTATPNVSPLEYYTKKEIKDVFYVGVIGAINLIRPTLRIMREKKSGVIINISNSPKLVGVPCQSLYSASKCAIDGLSSSLRAELKDFGINVSTINAKTFDLNKTTSTLQQSDEYYPTYTSTHNTLLAQQEKQASVKKIVRIVYKTSMKKSPRKKINIGVKNIFKRTLNKQASKKTNIEPETII